MRVDAKSCMDVHEMHGTMTDGAKRHTDCNEIRVMFVFRVREASMSALGELTEMVVKADSSLLDADT